ncbi:metal-sensing transcriptional repressor [Rugamonas sp. CCM 8940]|uniref:metal-sensing transcriptional repressor n=1 Tax=Rugamonas sp. CCM 8940 TaxID=2765359 RepID=UPI0018F3F297|nr:metal-sensing transcriptional repressor [Rugamonas sp. CCM 8940]MBJ7308874.1 metal-sensing transcriptional repressor [Rugamonas sp. CCM 8940]
MMDLNSSSQSQHCQKIDTLRCVEESLGATIRMLEHGQDRLEIARQLQALEKTLQSMKRGLISEHRALHPMPWDL